MNLHEIENAVTQLSHKEMARFVQWFEEYRAEQWDQQIEADIKVGRLDVAGQRTDADFEAGRFTSL